MNTPQFDSAEWASIAHHLRVAATQYDRDAEQVRDDSPRLAAQFQDQAKQAREMSNRIEENA